MEYKRSITPTTAMLLAVTVSALFAVVVIVLGLRVCIFHPFTAVVYGICALLMSIGFLWSSFRATGKEQMGRVVGSLVPAVLFVALTLWNGHLATAVNAVFLPLSLLFSVIAVAVFVREKWGRLLKKVLFYILLVTAVVVVLFVQLGVADMLPEASDTEDATLSESVDDEEDAQTGTPVGSETEENTHKKVPVAFFVAWGIVLILIICAVIKYISA